MSTDMFPDAAVEYLLRADTLELWTAEVAEVNVANGWYEDERTFGEDIALLHSEISEMLEAFRDHGLDDVTGAIHNEGDRCLNENGAHVGLCKPEGVGSEAADVLIRLLDTCHRRNIDPGELRHYADQTKRCHPLMEWGQVFGDDITTLHRTVALSAPWVQSLAPILARLEEFADTWGIDLATEYHRKVTFNRTRGHRHGGKRL